MENDLTRTLARVVGWTEGKYDAVRAFHSSLGKFCVIIRPFVYKTSSADLLRMADEGYVPEDVWLLYDDNPARLSQRVKDKVIYDIALRR